MGWKSEILGLLCFLGFGMAVYSFIFVGEFIGYLLIIGGIVTGIFYIKYKLREPKNYNNKHQSVDINININKREGGKYYDNPVEHSIFRHAGFEDEYSNIRFDEYDDGTRIKKKNKWF